MSTFEVFLALYMGLLVPVAGGLFSARLRRIATEISDLRSEMATIRSDLTHVALAVGARPRPASGN